MGQSKLNARIVDGLLLEATVLAMEVQHLQAGQDHARGAAAEPTPAGLDHAIDQACRRLDRATAWLTDKKDYFAGRNTLLQSRLSGRLAPDVLPAAADRATALPEAVEALLAATANFYARVLQAEAEWLSQFPATKGAIARLRNRNGA